MVFPWLMTLLTSEYLGLAFTFFVIAYANLSFPSTYIFITKEFSERLLVESRLSFADVNSL
jgi:hypothetical protein